MDAQPKDKKSHKHDGEAHTRTIEIVRKSGRTAWESARSTTNRIIISPLRRNLYINKLNSVRQWRFKAEKISKALIGSLSNAASVRADSEWSIKHTIESVIRRSPLKFSTDPIRLLSTSSKKSFVRLPISRTRISYRSMN